MPSNKPQSNYSKRPLRRVRLLKFGPSKTKTLLEEYFYFFLAAVTTGVMILGKAGGMSGSDAIVTGLWVGAAMWVAWQFNGYRNQKGATAEVERVTQEPKPNGKVSAKPLSPGFKPMVGPQWPVKAAPNATAKSQPGQQGKKQVFVYERPTLPDRPPKFPANWSGSQDKKPRQ
jgi:hypothetical protein